MSNEALIQAIKNIVALGKAGKPDESYAGYRDLFSGAGFSGNKPEDQRQALKLMILVKGAPAPPTAAMVEAYRAAIAPLRALVDAHGEPSDHELLGICYVTTGDEASASKTFRAGLTIERERNPQSDLCGALMKRVSLL